MESGIERLFALHRDELGAFLRDARKGERIAVFHDRDADGIAAAAVLSKALARAGFGEVACAAPNLERSPWTESNRAIIRELRPDRLFVLDLGVQAEPVLPGVPTCYIDHHQPRGMPSEGAVLTGYGVVPTPCTSVLAWESVSRIAGVSDLAWIAAIGAISDLGDKAPFEALELARRQHGVTCLKEATALVNAVRRSANPDPSLALGALMAAHGPRELLESRSKAVERMREARREVHSAMIEAKKAVPRMAGRIALIETPSPCQVHSLIAQIWRAKLPGYLVIAANDQYLPGRVVFSARSSGETNALGILRAADIGEGEGSYGHGHDQASGGNLPIDRWRKLLGKLGFLEGASS